MVLESEFPSDERVEKEIAVLMKAGFSVAISTYTFKNLPFEEKYNGYVIFRKKIPVWIYKASAASLLLPFYFIFWKNFLERILHNSTYDIIHVHDLPLSKPVISIANKYGLKVVCDQHEYYSNWIVRTRHYNKGTGKIIKFLSPWKKYEKKNLLKANLVVTVSDLLRDIYIKNVNIAPEKIVCLPNTTELSVFNEQNVDWKIKDKYKNRFVLFYAGGLDHLRGIEFICEGISRLAQTIPEILFVVAGKENRAFSMQDIIRKFGIENHVDFIGWISRSQLPSYVAASNICLFVPKADNLEINNTIVTKIFQYVAMGKPVIVSEAKMMKEFIEINRLGFSVDFGNVSQFQNIVLKMYSSPELAVRIKQNASRVHHIISWEETSKVFVGKYIEMSKNR